MHTILVIILILTISLCNKNSLHNPISFTIINNVIALTTDAPVGKHQRKLVSQVKLKLNPVNFPKTHVFRIKIFDNTAGPINQSGVT